MLTILAFLNFIGALFNCALCIFTFSIVDEIEFKPEKSTELSGLLSKYFPLEFAVLLFNMGSAIFHHHWFQFIVLLPMVIFNLHL
jgi:hypothetical protein